MKKLVKGRIRNRTSIKPLSIWRMKVYLGGNNGITEEEINAEKAEILRKFNLTNPYPTLLNDVVWNLLNKLTFKYAHDFQKLSSVHFLMAAFLEYEGQKRKMILPQSILASKYQLLDIKSRGRDKVACISAKRENKACLNCTKLNGQAFTIYQAMKDLPIPNKCTNKRCRCTYNDWFGA